MSRLLNKIAIITGGASGQGAAEAELFAKEGAKVVIADVQIELMEETAAKINALYPDSVTPMYLNVTDLDNWNQVVQDTVEIYGTIDVLVNNAGISGNLGVPVEDIAQDDWNRVLDINLNGNFLGIKAVTPIMKEKRSGSIINISSIAGLVGGQAGAHYTASKGASRLLTKTVAVELAPFGIRVNSIHPGGVATPMIEAVMNEDMKEQVAKTIPAGYIADPIEIAYPVLFLASDESSYMYGSEVVVDGGMVAI